MERGDSRGPSGGPRGNFDGGRGGGGPRGNFEGGRGNFDRVLDKLRNIEGPQVDLPALDMSERKFSGRARIYIGNFTTEMSEEALKTMVSAEGDVGEMFFNREKNFAFVRMSTRSEAEKVKTKLDGQMKNGRALKVRFSPHQGAVKVSNLGKFINFLDNFESLCLKYLINSFFVFQYLTKNKNKSAVLFIYFLLRKKQLSLPS